jgi:23S rRNA pseudoU1915 N3-methylase RlmH
MKRFLKDFEDSMAAAAFAQEGDPDTALEMMSERNEGDQGKKNIKVKDERAKSFIEKHDTTEEAIAFAQAGEQDYARELLKRDESERKKILVVGGEEGFSEALTAYAIGMADRMNFEITALNVIPGGKRIFSFLNDNEKKELLERAEEMASKFSSKAAEKNITFVHTVKFGESEKVIKDLHREVKRIAFVLTEPETLSDDNTSRASIPVFCLADV